MVVAAMLLAAQPAPEFSEFTPVERRIDCHATLRQDDGDGRYGFPAIADYVFLLLSRDARADRRAVLTVITREDGITMLDRGVVTAERGGRWPDYSASLRFHQGTVTLTSDPRRPGRIALRAVIVPPAATQIVGEGSCETYPRDRRARP